LEAKELKTAILYFSGTGNTMRTGEVFKHYFEERGSSV